MIKEFCMACRGTGISGYYNSATSHKVIDCDYCQGKGYTELEPIHTDIESAFARMIGLFDIDNDRAIEVYIKELKNE